MSRRSRDLHPTGSRNGYGDTYGESYEPKAPPHSHLRDGRREYREHHHHKKSFLPRFTKQHSNQVTPGIAPEGESGRRGFHPFKFLAICFRSTSRVSMLVNILWPFVPAAIALYFARKENHLWIFILSYIAMVPAANLIGFAGQELARKLPKVFGVVLETTFGSVVEIILFMILIKKGEEYVQIIRAAILGSILANLLLCLGMCFFVGGFNKSEQTFHEAISEVGSGLMLVAGMGLVLPAVFGNSLASADPEFYAKTTSISRATSIMLLIAFVVYVWFQAKSHHGLYDDIFEADEQRDADRHKDLAKAKLTFTECIVALLFAIGCVSLIAYILVQQIHPIVEERHVSDAFIGLILVPLVEKAAEHLTAIDEAYDNQANFALAHVLGASIQTALLNAPLVVLVGWGLKVQMNFNFEVFDAVALILAILVVGNFLRDGKSNYLEGALCIIVYVIIAVVAWNYPNPNPANHGLLTLTESGGSGSGESGGGGH